MKAKVVILCSAVLIMIMVQTLSLAEQSHPRLREPESAALIPMTVLARSGTIKITQPDGTILIIEPDQPLPDIFSGSKVEVINGEILFLTEDAIISIEANEGVIFSQSLLSGKAIITVTSGDIEIITKEKERIILSLGYSYYTATGEIVAPAMERPYEPEPKEVSPYMP
ncbi:MAG: hypothetical protein ABIH19_03680 [Candidatus Omnitrophota bacterium]